MLKVIPNLSYGRSMFGPKSWYFCPVFTPIRHFFWLSLFSLSSCTFFVISFQTPPDLRLGFSWGGYNNMVCPCHTIPQKLQHWKFRCGFYVFQVVDGGRETLNKMLDEKQFTRNMLVFCRTTPDCHNVGTYVPMWPVVDWCQAQETGECQMGMTSSWLGLRPRPPNRNKRQLRVNKKHYVWDIWWARLWRGLGTGGYQGWSVLNCVCGGGGSGPRWKFPSCFFFL